MGFSPRTRPYMLPPYLPPQQQALMQYRREIDGLRAIAVIPVILCHAQYELFRGGFVGVDVFFVISGYFITEIIVKDLKNKDFSLLYFYERRVRRILPALLVVMVATSPFAYMWMMPDEFKNYGQSIVATTLFSNNILLAMTSGYWSLASEYKPLLHTWSLGVEEQYYMIFPLAAMLAWRFARSHLLIILTIIFLSSFLYAAYSVIYFPAVAFYILPTRGWELLAGAILAFLATVNNNLFSRAVIKDLGGLIGLSFIAFSVLTFDESYLSPGPWILFPVSGAMLIIYFAKEGTIVHKILSIKLIVGIGLISYSLYLWHQPIFALARIYAMDSISPQAYAILIVLTFILSYFTWRYVEVPFRDRNAIGRPAVLTFSLTGSICLIFAGIYLNHTYGMAWRAFGPDISIRDMDKRFYNERVFSYKVNHFANDGRLKIFILGNSFGRDFVNMTIEAFDTKKLDIAYSDNFDVCVEGVANLKIKNLFESADVIVFASGYDGPSSTARHCITKDIAWARGRGKGIFFVGTKDFGNNLNWVIRLDKRLRADLHNRMLVSAIRQNDFQKGIVPPDNFISLMDQIEKNNMIPITDENGIMISTDRKHVTKFGAIFFGHRVVRPSSYGKLIENYLGKASLKRENGS